MNSHEEPKTGHEIPDEHATGNPLTRLARIIGQAARFNGDAHGLGTGEHAALARINPYGELRPHQVAALTRVLLNAGLEPDKDNWRPETWHRWALIAHGMALAGHDGTRNLGEQLSSAGIAESRVTKLLTARGDAFRQLLPRLLRLLASKDVAPNWHQLGGLILHEGRDEPRAESIRLAVAGRYFSARERATEKPSA